ncbi:MAG: Holliday junction resolvase RuvX [Rickettsiaceae bacterium]|nr:Holliday junction resolvase RuvX [Rickettsiaceae bacterium]
MKICKTIEELIDLAKDGPLICLDYGAKKVGIAISSPNRSIALPLGILANDSKKIYASIQNLISKHNIEAIIIGLPLLTDGKETSSTLTVKNFAQKILSCTNLPIFLQEERRTTLAADSLLKIAGFNRKERSTRDDTIAACLILESVLGRIEP